ncbi:mitochondrial carrier [Pseudovirgaria hyperparasitica]|uniref:Mitochondrial carrier n=1 Tax=Pseudovirgaria hyperparasitica TaxID=470096 RepID=A0A6A6VWT3_9PEZI|nr:mitochondrial carrier [Pseudovirgaria hyperparasitica]KAF2755052.1 mitochondrial carrier [Pseudovirgaria hyperparasitica]
MPKDEKAHTSPYVSIISGGVAGGIEAFSTYPFEFTKTRVQLHQEKGISQKLPRNPYKIAFQLYRDEGLRAMYKGCGSLVVGSIAKDAVRFLSFDTVKNAFKDPETGTLSPLRNMLGGMVSGVVASIFAVTPTERLKTALIDDARGAKRYKNGVHAIQLIIKEDGLKGLYRGFVGTTLKQAGATSFRMGSYNIIKDYERTKGITQNTAVNFINGSIAGIITTVSTQPFDVIKTRSQTAKVTTTKQAIASVMKYDGIKGFWRGTVMRLSRTVFSGGILFTSAEAVAKIIDPLFTQQTELD